MSVDVCTVGETAELLRFTPIGYYMLFGSALVSSGRFARDRARK